MKREIEINRAVNSYISIYFGSYIRDVERAFRNGIEWADEHPKNVWHPADEEPGDKDWKILLETKSGYYWVGSRCSASFFAAIGKNMQKTLD